MADQVCSVCFKKGAKKCSSCKLQYYCSSKCQQKDWKTHKGLCQKAGPDHEVCAVCAKDGSKKCSKCKLQYYCSKECQKKDWKNHKAICKEVYAAAEYKKSSLQPPTGISSEISNAQKDMFSHMLSMTSNTGITISVPEYHKEYKKQYPREKADVEKLRDSWIMAKAMNASVLGDAVVDRGRDYGVADLMKRWQYYGPALVTFLNSKPKPGDIFTDRIPDPYGAMTSFSEGSMREKTVYQAMRNTPVVPANFYFGSTYVSVGFVDMFPLLVGSFLDDMNGPLRFVGYDKSEVVIARAIVIREMMLRGMQVETILQVWFSTGWNRQTKEDFQQICNNLVKNKDLVIEPRVKTLLNHWSSSEMSAKAVLPLWKQFVREYQLEPLNNLHHEADRVAYARYMLTGQIFGSHPQDYAFGNVSIFSLPAEFDNYFREDQNFFAALSFKDFKYEGSLMTSISRKFTKGVETLMTHIKSKAIVCQFFLRNINRDDIETLEEIKALNPRVHRLVKHP